MAACHTQSRPQFTPTKTPVTPSAIPQPADAVSWNMNTPSVAVADSPTGTSSPAITASPSDTYPPMPTFTHTLNPPERLVYVEQRTQDMGAGIAFIYSDGTGYERPEFLEPFIHISVMGSRTGVYLAPSPNGRYLAFDGYNESEPCDIPDSDCFTTNNGIIVADLQNQIIAGYVAGTSDNPSWSPDSKQLVASVALNLPDAGGEAWFKHNLVIYDVETGQLLHFLENFSDDLFPAWSPEGNGLLFCVRSRAILVMKKIVNKDCTLSTPMEAG
jgi:WD40-like Beta Propeller Repeat